MKLKFNEKRHEYSLGTRRLLSVTQFIGKYFPKFDAKEVARKLAKFPKNKLEKKGVRYWLALWKESSNHGTRIHNALDKYISGIPISEISKELEEQDIGKVTNGISWVDLNAKKLKKETELVIYDDELGLAGTIDLVIHNEDGTITLVDWKTNKEIKREGYTKKDMAFCPIETLTNSNYNKYTLQLSVYAYMMERKGYKVKNLILLHLKDNAMVSYTIEYLKETVEAILNDYKKGKE